MKKFDFNRKTYELFQKFIMLLNDVSDEAEAIADVAKKDETESGEVSLRYWLDNEHYITVDKEGFCRDEEMNIMADGEYTLTDGNILVIQDGKFVETRPMAESTTDEKVEPTLEEELNQEEEIKNELNDTKTTNEIAQSIAEDNLQVDNMECKEDTEIKQAAVEIENLKQQIEEKDRQIEELKQQLANTPSTTPKEANVEKNDKDTISDMIRKLNRR